MGVIYDSNVSINIIIVNYFPNKHDQSVACCYGAKKYLVSNSTVFRMILEKLLDSVFSVYTTGHACHNDSLCSLKDSSRST